MSYEQLPEQTRAGITPEMWESWTPEQQKALLSDRCIERGCKNPCWKDLGSFRCEQHTRERSLKIEREHRRDGRST